MSGMKDILAQYQKQYAKKLKQSPEQREAEGAIWSDMTGSIRSNGIELLKQYAAEHSKIEKQWLADNKPHNSDSAEFKRVANRHILIRNGFAVLYKIAPEELLT